MSRRCTLSHTHRHTHTHRDPGCGASVKRRFCVTQIAVQNTEFKELQSPQSEGETQRPPTEEMTKLTSGNEKKMHAMAQRECVCERDPGSLICPLKIGSCQVTF